MHKLIHFYIYFFFEKFWLDLPFSYSALRASVLKIMNRTQFCFVRFENIFRFSRKLWVSLTKFVNTHFLLYKTNCKFSYLTLNPATIRFISNPKQTIKLLHKIFRKMFPKIGFASPQHIRSHTDTDVYYYPLAETTFNPFCILVHKGNNKLHHYF